jgi:tetratricopeptide (TPR) repeat protein
MVTRQTPSGRIHAGLLAVGLASVGVAMAARMLIHFPKPSPLSALPAAEQKRLFALDQEMNRLTADVTAKPNDTKARWALADFFQRIGRIDKAGDQLREILKLEPDSTLAWNAMGNVLIAEGKFREAEQFYRDATRRWPKAAPAWQGLAATQFHERRYLDAADSARTAVLLDRKEPNGRFILGAALLEYVEQIPNPEEYESELKVARNNFMLILGAWPDKGDVYYRLGRANLLLHEGPDAIKNLRRAMELMPANGDVSIRLARSYIGIGKRDAALRVLTDAVVRFPKSAGIHSMLGTMLQDDPGPDAETQAFEHLRQATLLAPDSAVFLERYGAACLRINRLDEARAALESAQKLDRNNELVYQQLAVLYSRLGDHASSVFAAKTARDMMENGDKLRRVQALSNAHPRDPGLHLVLANRYRELGRQSAASDEYEIASRLEPGNAEAKRGLEQVSQDQATNTAHR